LRLGALIRNFADLKFILVIKKGCIPEVKMETQFPLIIAANDHAVTNDATD
jgi:hypothetical protein